MAQFFHFLCDEKTGRRMHLLSAIERLISYGVGKQDSFRASLSERFRVLVIPEFLSGMLCLVWVFYPGI